MFMLNMKNRSLKGSVERFVNFLQIQFAALLLFFVYIVKNVFNKLVVDNFFSLKKKFNIQFVVVFALCGNAFFFIVYILSKLLNIKMIFKINDIIYGFASKQWSKPMKQLIELIYQ